MRIPLLMHLHLHANAQRRYADHAVNGHAVNGKRRTFSRAALLGLVDNLQSAIGNLHWNPQGTEWGDYYGDTNYSPAALQHKKELVEQFLDQTRPKSLWDLGGNTGLFSRLASDRGINTVCMDADPAAVEKNYQQCVERREKHLLPLVQDLTNPSAGAGWANEERQSLRERGGADAVMALALVHHLAISHNLPFRHIARFLGQLCRDLLIEFVPKSDSQVQRLLRSREDIFNRYNRESFEEDFQHYFVITHTQPIRDSARILYTMQRKTN